MLTKMNFVQLLQQKVVKLFSLNRYNMVALVYACVFWVLIGCVSTTPREINPNGTCTRLKCEKTDANGVMLHYMSGHAIEDHTIFNRSYHSSMHGEESDCLKQCIAVPTCITVLVWIAERKCWLYEGDDVYAKPESIVPRKGSKIVTLGNGVCKQQPCNNGKCIPNFDGTGEFTCECNTGFSGERCNKKGAALHFSFDQDTSHGNAALSDVKMQLNKARLVRVPDRLGKVLMMREPRLAITMSVGPISQVKVGKWISNPWPAPKSKLTATFWVKMSVVPEILGDRYILELPNWVIVYNGGAKIFKAYISSEGAADGSDPINNMECPVDKIDKWTFVALAMSGPAGRVRMYLDGEMCQSKDVSAVKPDLYRKWIENGWFLKIFNDNAGISLMDDLKFYNSFPASDDDMRKAYAQEKKGGTKH